jgi:SAM-dependent methyltransferase
MARLQGEYYATCNEVFRRSTDQGERVLDALLELVHDRKTLGLLSVGSGTGLLEVPLLKRLLQRRVELTGFFGIDASPVACRLLTRRLATEFRSRLAWEVANLSFEEFQTDRRFDLVLFAHTFEYLQGPPQHWVRKSLDLLAPAGLLLIVSPDRGGINQIYAERAEGFQPIFSDDLRGALLEGEPVYATQPIQAECDISLLDRPDRPADAIALLSFLTQLDCRRLPEATRERFIDYYRALRPAGRSTIAHPATLFVFRGA